MNQVKNILACVDLSNEDRIVSSTIRPSSMAVIDRAIWIAKMQKIPLTFFTTLDLSANAYEYLLEEEEQAHNQNNVEDQANKVMDELVEKAKAEGVEAEKKIVFGKAWEEIIREVLRSKIDLVLIGSRSETKFNKMLFGSTGQKLMRLCPCPVLVTRPDLQFSNPKILVPTDFSGVSQDALNFAAEISRLPDATVCLMHVIESYFDYHMKTIGLNEDKMSYYKEQAYKHVNENLEKQLSNLDDQSLRKNIQTSIEEGPAEVCILEKIMKDNIDIVVMGTIARTGFKGFFIGNTAEKVLPLISCSLLAVKPEGFETPVSLDD